LLSISQHQAFGFIVAAVFNRQARFLLQLLGMAVANRRYIYDGPSPTGGGKSVHKEAKEAG
jgi:hypothetical protein